MGVLLIGRSTPSFERGVAHVWIEAPAPADAPAVRLAETRVDGISHCFGQADEFPFTIQRPKGLPANARLRAWVDVLGCGSAAPGDLFSTETVTVSDRPCLVRLENSTPQTEPGGQ